MITAIRKLAENDSQGRIKCSAHQAECGQNARFVEQHESAGAMFFWYFCSEHITKAAEIDPFQNSTPCWHEKSFQQFNIQYFG